MFFCLVLVLVLVGRRLGNVAVLDCDSGVPGGFVVIVVVIVLAVGVVVFSFAFVALATNAASVVVFCGSSSAVRLFLSLFLLFLGVFFI